MELKNIRIKALTLGITMTELAKEIGVDRRTMYKKISKKDPEIQKKIKKALDI